MNIGPVLPVQRHVFTQTSCALCDVLQIPIPHVTCVTLGSPLVGDKNFAERFLELCKGGTTEGTLDCTRIIHAQDPVPMVPPAQWGCVPRSWVLLMHWECSQIKSTCDLRGSDHDICRMLCPLAVSKVK